MPNTLPTSTADEAPAMTGTIEKRHFTEDQAATWEKRGERFVNWPVVYLLNDPKRIYVGETLNVVARMRQHLRNPEKASLTTIRVALRDSFNKSAALDLESYLIQRFAAEARFDVVNRNLGITNADYFRRDDYQLEFKKIFGELHQQGLFQQSLLDIENSDLFKLSPFKSLEPGQLFAVNDILTRLFADLTTGRPSTITIQGDPGTGKTVVGIYLMKLLQDIKSWTPESDDETDEDVASILGGFFTEQNAALLQNFRSGLVVPQQSLRQSIGKVFSKTPGLHPDMVMTQFEAATAVESFDLLIVDETHRLTQRANQSSGPLNGRFADITEALFGDREDYSRTQINWIKAKSKHQLFLMDMDQSVRPADVPRRVLEELVYASTSEGRHFQLSTQMRVLAGADYIAHTKKLFTSEALTAPWPETGDYDFRVFDNLVEMRDAILARDEEVGLSRLVAGYGFEWKSKKDQAAADIERDGLALQWNRKAVDWVNSPGSVNEVGSIHTIQGYDLNYAGVIIAPELRYNPSEKRFYLDRARYYDKKGKENSDKLGRRYSDDDILEWVKNIYSVLMSRGMLGTYVYAATPELRDFLRQLPIPARPQAASDSTGH